MGQFINPVDLEALEDGDHWKTLDPIVYICDNTDKIIVPCGFVTDLASVPRVFWNILPPFGKYDGAAIIHDFIYSKQIYTRSQCDDILLEAMKSEGVNWLTRYTIYWGVRAGGWLAWEEHKHASN
jgi:hypothetical protein